MAGLIARSSLPILVKRQIIKAFIDEFDSFESMIGKFFDQETSNGSFERYQEMVGFSRHKEKAEGAQAELDSLEEGPETLIRNKSYALGYQITHEMIEDNEYPQVLRNMKQMGQSAAETREAVVFDRLNTAFSTTAADFIADGKALCAIDHPIYKAALDGSTTNKNRPTNGSSLSEASLTVDMDNIANFKSPAGLKISTKSKVILVPQELDVRTQKLLFSDLEVDSNNNAINPFARNRGRLPGGYVVSQYLTNPDAYFMRLNVDGLVYQEREARRIMEDLKQRQMSQEVISYMRFGVGAYDHRAVYGNPGS